MIKKILVSLMTLCTVISLLLVFYCFFKPNNTDAVALSYSTESLIIPYSSVKDYAIANGNTATSYLFFCQPENSDCQYMQNTVMKSLEAEQGSKLSDYIDYVDVSELEESLAINQLADEWGIKSYPAFVSVTNNYGELVINNSIQWDIENPMNARELKQWMILNNIWLGLFDESDGEVLLPQ